MSKKKFSFVELLLFAFGVLIFAFFVRTSKIIMNYPLSYYIVIVSILTIIIFVYKNINRKISIDSFFELIGIAVISSMIGALLILPFNYYIINQAKENIIEKISSSIVAINHRQNLVKGFYYNYNQETKLYLDYDNKEIKKMFLNKNWSTYKVVFDVKKSILDTYLIIDYEIIEK